MAWRSRARARWLSAEDEDGVHRNRVFWSAETVWMVEGEIGCDEMGETQSGSTVSMELTHVRKPSLGPGRAPRRPGVSYAGTASERTIESLVTSSGGIASVASMAAYCRRPRGCTLRCERAAATRAQARCARRNWHLLEDDGERGYHGPVIVHSDRVTGAAGTGATVPATDVAPPGRVVSTVRVGELRAW